MSKNINTSYLSGHSKTMCRPFSQSNGLTWLCHDFKEKLIQFDKIYTFLTPHIFTLSASLQFSITLNNCSVINCIIPKMIQLS